MEVRLGGTNRTTDPCGEAKAEGRAPACPSEFTEAVILQMGARAAIFSSMRQIHYTLYREDSEYVAQCLDYDVSSFGATKEEALAMLKEAVELYLEDETAMASAPEISELSVGELSIA